jgi:hypothetical protein
MQVTYFKRLIKKALLPDLRFHDLQHTSATLLLAQGVHSKIVQERPEQGRRDLGDTCGELLARIDWNRIFAEGMQWLEQNEVRGPRN